MGNQLHRLTLIIAAIAASAGLMMSATGCGARGTRNSAESQRNSSEHPTGEARPGRNSESIDDSSTATYRPELKPASCVDPSTATDRIDCLTLTLPEDRFDPTGRQVELPVLWIHGTVPNDLPPAVFLHGGPGSGAVAGWAAWLALTDGLGRDLIVYDQRGGGSAIPRLECPEHNVALSAILSEHPPWTDSRVQVGSALRTCNARLRSEGVDLGQYDTATAVRDLEDLRVEIQADQLSLIGSSYGTRLALSYRAEHPKRVSSLVLGGVDAPGTEEAGRALELLNGAVSRLATACGTDGPCATTYPNLEASLERAAADFDARPAVIETLPSNTEVLDNQSPQSPSAEPEPITVKVTGDELYAGLFAALYDTSAIRLLPSVIESFASGNRSLLDTIGPKVASTIADGSAFGAQMSITCGDLAESGSTRRAKQSVADPGRARDIALSGAIDFCEFWSVTRTGRDDRDAVQPSPGTSNPHTSGPRTRDPGYTIPTLIIAGELDPITPAEDAKTLADTLGATFIEVPHGGHDAMLVDPCARGALRSFLTDPTVVKHGCDSATPLPFA